MSAVATRSILLRVSEVEHAEISRLAGDAGQSLSRFIVSRTLGEGVQAPALELARARAALQAALRALGGAQVQEVSEVVLEAPEVAPPQEAAIAPAIAPPPTPAPVEPEPVVQAPQLPEPEIVLVSAAHSSKTEGGQCKWIRAVGEVDRYGVDGHAIKPPKGMDVFLKAGRETRIRPGTLVVACLESTTYYPVLHVGWTVAGKRGIQWRPWDADDSTLEWHSSKLSTLQDLRQILRRGPPGSPVPAPEPVSPVEVRPPTPAEQAVCVELDEALATTTTTNPFDDMIF